MLHIWRAQLARTQFCVAPQSLVFEQRTALQNLAPLLLLATVSCARRKYSIFERSLKVWRCAHAALVDSTKQQSNATTKTKIFIFSCTQIVHVCFKK